MRLSDKDRDTFDRRLPPTMVFPVEVPKAGTYAISLDGLTGPKGAQLQLQVDDSLRYALVSLPSGYVWAALHLWRSSRTVAADLAAVRLDEESPWASIDGNEVAAVRTRNQAPHASEFSALLERAAKVTMTWSMRNAY